MVSKRVTRRSTAAADIASAADSWSATTQKIVEDLLGPYLSEGEAFPDLAIFQKLLGRLVADEGKKLTGSDEKLDHHQALAVHLRGHREREAENLRELLRTAKFYLDRVDGRGAGKRLGLGHGLSKMNPVDLTRLGHDVAGVLQIDRKNSGANLAGMSDPAELSRAITEQAAKLRQVLDDLAREKIGAGFHRGEQKRGLKKTERTVRRAAGLLAELYKFCNHLYLAKKIRPVFRRRSRAKKSAAVTETPPAAEPGILEDLDWSTVEPVDDRPLRQNWTERPRVRIVRKTLSPEYVRSRD